MLNDLIVKTTNVDELQKYRSHRACICFNMHRWKSETNYLIFSLGSHFFLDVLDNITYPEQNRELNGTMSILKM
jgi:hypothetical protein